MDFFFDLFDSEKKRKAQLQLQQQQQQQHHHHHIRTRTGSGGELPPLRRDRGYRTFSFRKYDQRESNRIREERLRRELHRLYLWDSKCSWFKNSIFSDRYLTNI